jgi:methyl-accepting chemotaxis protein
MADGETTASAVKDMLRVEQSAISKMRDELRDLIEEIKQEREELRKDHDLVRELAKEYDRLSQRMSVQLQAIVKVTQDLSKL